MAYRRFFYMKIIVSFLFYLLAYIINPGVVWGIGLLSGDYINFNLFINDRIHCFNDFLDSGKKKFSQDRNLHIFYANASLTALLGPHIQGVLELDSEFIYNLEKDNSDDDLDVRNAYIQTILPGLNWIAFSIGRQAISTINGFIYDNEAPAFRLQADMERGFTWPLKFQMLVAEVENDSPYIHAEFKYNFAFFESVTFFYGWFRDTNDGIARIFNYLEEERLYKSRGKIQWIGFSARKFWGNAFLRTSFIYERGSVSLRHQETGRHTMQMRGYLFDMNCF